MEIHLVRHYNVLKSYFSVLKVLKDLKLDIEWLE